VYPYKDDMQRPDFSRLLRPHISGKWCAENNAECDPENFETNLVGQLALNETAKVFGFEAEFSPSGFGDIAQKQVPSRTVVYVFHERGGKWEHREFEPRQLQALFGVTNVRDLVGQQPNVPFAPVGGK